MPEYPVALAPMSGGRHIGLAVDDIGDMADERGIENAIDRGLVVGGALVKAFDAAALAGREGRGLVRLSGMA